MEEGAELFKEYRKLSQVYKQLSWVSVLVLFSFILPMQFKMSIQNEIIAEIVFYGGIIFILFCWHCLFEVGNYIHRLEERIKYYEKKDE